jgi:aminopeptidase-like protein
MTFSTQKEGEPMHTLLSRLYPICRSLTGTGVRETLSILREYLPRLEIREVPSGTSCLDWTVPQEWTIEDAWIEDDAEKRWVDFKESNLHVVGYSLPVDAWLTPDELDLYLYSLPDKPEAIPYVTSYYAPRWGFCVSHNLREQMKKYSGRFHAVVDSDLKQGFLTYGELVLPGETDREVLLSTYICHPSMANDNLSGPVVATFLAQWLASRPRRLTYRVLFIPETLGSFVYLSQHLEELKSKVVAGYVLTCCGDEKAWSFLPSRAGDTLADHAARHVLKHYASSEYKEYSFLTRGSDERNWCAPGVDLPVASIMRSKYGTFPEYHTSLDNLNFVTGKGLGESLEVYRRCMEVLENNKTWHTTCLGEPQLGKRGLYPTISHVGSAEGWVRDMKNILAYSDEQHDLLFIAETIDAPFDRCLDIVEKLSHAGLLRSDD